MSPGSALQSGLGCATSNWEGLDWGAEPRLAGLLWAQHDVSLDPPEPDVREDEVSRHGPGEHLGEKMGTELETQAL